LDNTTKAKDNMKLTK